MDNVVEIRPIKKRVFHDDHVVGFWDFGGSEDIKLNGCEYVTEDDSSAIKLDLSKGDYFEIPNKDGLNQKEAVTIEMRFKMKDLKSPSGSYIVFLIKGVNYGQGNENYCLLLWPSTKQIQPTAYLDNFNQIYARYRIDIQAEKWHHITTVFDPKNSKIEQFLDGKKVSHMDHYVHSGGAGLAQNDSALAICKNRGSNNNTIWFDYIRISNKVRTEEEIKEFAESGWMDSLLKPSQDREFNSVVVTKSGERYQCKLSEALEVGTEIGDMKLDPKSISSILFFEYRKEQIEALHKKAKDLITKLGAEDPTVREKSQADLKNLGWVIIPVLEEYKDSQDEELKSRVKKLLEGYVGKKFEIGKDEIRGKGIELRGWVKLVEVRAKTRYGEVTVKAEDIKGIVFGVDYVGNIIFLLKDRSKLSGKLLQDEIEISSEFGKVKVPVKEIVKIEIGKDVDLIVTRKSTLKGTIEQDEFELETDLGKMKIKKQVILNISTAELTKSPSSDVSSDNPYVPNMIPKSMKHKSSLIWEE